MVPAEISTQNEQTQPSVSEIDPFLRDYFTKDQLANTFGYSTRTLDRWEVLRIGPPRIKVGKMILYRRVAVMEWLKANECDRRGRTGRLTRAR